MEALREDMYVGKGDKCVHKIGREAVIRVTEEPPGGMVCHCGGDAAQQKIQHRFLCLFPL